MVITFPSDPGVSRRRNPPHDEQTRALGGVGEMGVCGTITGVDEAGTGVRVLREGVLVVAGVREGVRLGVDAAGVAVISWALNVSGAGVGFLSVLRLHPASKTKITTSPVSSRRIPDTPE